MSIGSSPLRTFEVEDVSQGVPQGAPQDLPYPNAIPIENKYGPSFSVGSGPQQNFVPPPQSQQIQFNTSNVNIPQKKPTPSTGVMSRINFLAGIGRLKKDVDVEGTVFSIRTLNAKEQRAALLAAANVPAIETLFEGRAQQLARAIYAIDGVLIEEILGTSDVSTISHLLDEMDDNTLNYLYNHYSLLNEEANKKYAIKSPEDAKEVLDNVKK